MLATCVVVAVATAAAPAWAKMGRFSRISGDVTVNGAPAKSSTLIQSGDSIRTGRNGRATIIMRDRTVLDFDPNTDFAVTDYAFDKAKPEESRSTFSLLRGAFRFVSGLIAKARPERVAISTGGATMGVRGSFVEFVNPEGTNAATVISHIGTTTATFTDPPSTLTIGPGLQALLSEQATTSAEASAINTAASLLAADPTAANPETQAAVAALTDAAKVLTLAVMINNRSALGISSQETLNQATEALSSSLDGPTAQLMAFVAGALDPDNVDDYVAAIVAGSGQDEGLIAAAAEAGADPDATPDFVGQGTVGEVLQATPTVASP